MIQPSYFFDLLDCLAGQFFDKRSARCAGKEFGINISNNAKDYFSVAIIPEELPDNLAVLGVLLDDSAHIASRNGFTFTIYIDLRQYSEEIQRILWSIIIAHEICHFAFYYELFIKLGDSTGIRSHSYFTHAVSTKLIGAVTNEQDNTSQTIFEEHDIISLLSNLRKFPKIHFSKGKKTEIDYQQFLDNFLNHLNLDKLHEQYIQNREQNNR
jgi:hypothetical protein